MELANKRVLVAGMARSGVAAAALLDSLGARVTIYDQKTAGVLGEALAPLQGLPIEEALGVEPDSGKFDLVVTSPGIPLTAPVLKQAAASGVPVIGELELGAALCPCPYVAITGTNGKSTTVTLLGEVFKNAGFLSFCVGNIGLPITQVIPELSANDRLVVEVSSFQLETVRDFHPRVSAVLNITEDHLNRHGTMETYIDMKARIFENQGQGDFVVLNAEEPLTAALAQRARCRVAWFSDKHPVELGCFVEDGYVVFVNGEEKRRVVEVSQIRLPGNHNLQNAMAAACMAMLMEVPAPVIRHTLRSFAGIEHRIETVRTVGGVTYINDSKGTNVDASIQAVRAMDAPSVLIAGGYDKHTDFAPFAREIKNSRIHTVVLIGQTAAQIEKALREAGFANIRHASGFKEAVHLAGSLANRGEKVLLSPACASFDMFSDFEQRGRVFKEIVESL